MLFIRSKIQFFESKSQQPGLWSVRRFSCLSDQRYNFLKANHNSTIQVFPYNLLFIRSKIQFFESKSQHYKNAQYHVLCCLSDQRYNFLKANHNTPKWISFPLNVVYQIKDTIFWKQITTTIALIWLLCSCLSDQRYNFLKANHNRSFHLEALLSLFIRSKIQFFESKSQPILIFTNTPVCCLSDQRYNFLKANHNLPLPKRSPPKVVYQIKDTIFWKQITTMSLISSSFHRCLSDQRYNFLKANHNIFAPFTKLVKVVYQIKDTIFWKQITTLLPYWGCCQCCLSDQRYNFLKANHNRKESHPFYSWLFIRSKIQFFESKSQQ